MNLLIGIEVSIDTTYREYTEYNEDFENNISKKKLIFYISFSLTMEFIQFVVMLALLAYLYASIAYLCIQFVFIAGLVVEFYLKYCIPARLYV